MSQVIASPSLIDGITGASVFLAGSIDDGVAEDWQVRVCESLKASDLTILNPRRADWDSTWKQTIEDLRFREQVEWELNAMQCSSYILMHFTAESKAPITLLELGLHAQSGKLIISVL